MCIELSKTDLQPCLATLAPGHRQTDRPSVFSVVGAGQWGCKGSVKEVRERGRLSASQEVMTARESHYCKPRTYFRCRPQGFAARYMVFMWIPTPLSGKFFQPVISSPWP